MEGAGGEGGEVVGHRATVAPPLQGRGWSGERRAGLDASAGAAKPRRADVRRCAPSERLRRSPSPVPRS
ncbi:MAG: hypothetical protein AVDCRST_MAG39-380 [uncultured Sphingomonadaceae bacterium]|uniref:Uncharacterized protein n=1 Tax=uncultured Sphingomonadaceae bacterium TaxID=169976 RepID=A0A6J4RVA1_9SPHN|nr:MAG: hypothetical protein AVDCRST_MAG39-380 [uncultured Sphingomonadaceae bacterium]